MDVDLNAGLVYECSTTCESCGELNNWACGHYEFNNKPKEMSKMSKKTTTIIFDANVVKDVEAFMKDEDRKDFGPAVCVIIRRYLKLRSISKGSEK